MFWNVLAFSNLADLNQLHMTNCPLVPLDHLQRLASLKSLSIHYSSNSNVLLPADRESDVTFELPVECLNIAYSGAGEKELTQLLSHFHVLSELRLSHCENITMVSVVEQSQTTRGEEEITAGGEYGLLLSSPHLQKLVILYCCKLSLLGCSLKGLRSFRIEGCPNFSSSSCIWHLLAHGCLTELYIFKTPEFFACFRPPRAHDKEPTSCKLQKLETDDLTGLLVVPICSLLSSSITNLYFQNNYEVERFTMEQKDALQLLTSLQVLTFSGLDKLQCLPVGLHRLSSLKTLQIYHCEAFQLLPKDGLPTSLQKLVIYYCRAFKSLPNDSLTHTLQDLRITGCPSLESLPKDGLPSSLQDLWVSDCGALRSLPKDGLPCSLKKLTIWSCPALKSLPNDGLPNSLRVLELRGGNNKELMRQCRKLKGTLPIMKD